MKIARKPEEINENSKENPGKSIKIARKTNSKENQGTSMKLARKTYENQRT